MKRTACLTLIILLMVGISCKKENNGKLTKYVDAMIGTDATGNTYPGPCLPFGGVQLSPDTYNDNCCSGYHFSNKTILGFSHTHLSGTGCADFGDVLLMPTVGDIKITPGTEDNPDSGYRSRFSHENETTHPGYYRVLLDDYDIKAELTTTKRVGLHKYTFPKSENSHIILDLVHDISGGDEPKEDCFIRVINKHEIEGFRHSRGWATDQYVYFVAQFSEPFIEALLYKNDELQKNSKDITGENIKAVFNYKTEKNQPIMVKVGISAVNVDGARKNLKAELNNWDFTGVVNQAEEIWNNELSKIKVEGGTEDQKIKFYTAFYHALLTPNLFDDVDGKYRGMDHKIHGGEGFDYYHVFSLWDTYRAVHPFFNIVHPEKNVDFIKTMIKQQEHTGLLPVWELAGCENNCMIGYHSVPVIADAYLKSNNDFNINKAFEAMLASGKQNRSGIAAYREFEFIPRGATSNSVSKTLEYAYDDWCIAQVAKAIGREKEYKEYIKRSQFYQNHFEPESGLMRARHSDGTWSEPFDPLKVYYLEAGDYTEANAWHYSFYVPQNIPYHIEMMGGDERYNKMLDTFFTLESEDQEKPSDFVGKFGQYAHGNEPSHHMPYLYNYTGSAWKTQEFVRKTMNELYTTKPDGLCGNDDCGQLSSWYIFSAMGFYPVCPGQDLYVIGSPIFDKVVVDLPNGKTFTINSKNAGKENIYIQTITRNGHEYPYSYIKHSDILSGGEMTFVMGSKPNKEWGVAKDHRPYAVQIEKENILKPLGTERVFNPFLKVKSKLFTDPVNVELGCITEDAEIYYTLDGTEPDKNSRKYSNPFKTNSSELIKSKAFKNGLDPSGIAEHEVFKSNIDYKNNKTIVKYNAPESGKDVTGAEVDGKYSDSYSGGGDKGLIDGVLGTSHFLDGMWQGFYGKDMEVILDLGKNMNIEQISSGYLQSIGAWIFHPISVEYFVSIDGLNFKSLGIIDNSIDRNNLTEGVKYYSKKLKEQNIRYVKILAKNLGYCPDWHQGAGGKAWIFADEIIVE